MTYNNGEPEFAVGGDIVIKWQPGADSKDFDIRIYHVDTGQEVAVADHFTSPEFLPEMLSQSGRYQVFIRHTDMSDGTGEWSPPAYFTLAASGIAPIQKSAQLIGLTNDPAPALLWSEAEAVLQMEELTYEVVIYNVAAGQEVLREASLTGNSLSLESLLDSSDEFQAFIRTRRVNLSPVVYAAPFVGDWSAPFHFSGEGASMIPPAASFTSISNDVAPPTLSGLFEWQPVAGAEYYDVVLYNVGTGQVAGHFDGIIQASVETVPTQLNATTPPEVHHYQFFYRAHLSDGSTGLWSDALEINHPLPNLQLGSQSIEYIGPPVTAG